MVRAARAAAAVLAFLMLATPSPPSPDPGPGEAGAARLFSAAVPLNPEAPDERTLGPLRYLDGWVLSSDDRRFGAISGLAVDGEQLVALSDRGTLFRFRPGGGSVEILPLAEGPGDPSNKIDRDSEALALAAGNVWVGYENSNSVWRYRRGSLAAEAHAAPAEMRRWPANRGAESMARLADGRFLLIGEDEDEEGVSDAVLFRGDPAEPGTEAVRMRIDPPRGQRVTDVAMLPDGRLLLLTRGFTVWDGWTARLLLAELPQGGGEIATRQIAEFASPLTRDNMEAITIGAEGGRTIVWIASDDNLNSFQRTLLLKFEWMG